MTTVHTVKSKVEISQNFVAFSEYMYFRNTNLFIRFYAFCNSFWTKENTFLDCAGLKGLNNTDPDTDNSGLSSSKFLVFFKNKCDNLDIQTFGCT